MKKFLELVAWVATFMNFDPNSKESLEFSEEEKSKLDAQAGIPGFAEKFVQQFNDHKASEDNEAAQEMINQFMTETAGAGAEGSEAGDGAETVSGAEGSAKPAKKEKQNLTAMVKGLISTVSKQGTDIATLKQENEILAGEAEPDASIKKIKGNTPMKNNNAHSKTHLFASDASWNQFDGRPWNQAAKAGEVKSSSWNDVNIAKINSDLGAYARQNSGAILDLLMDGLSIPSHWEVISGVTDEHIFVSVATGDVTQAYKSQWLPNNNQTFEAIKNKVFDIQIDATWTVDQLKQIERSYLQQFFNKTSSPFKEDFVAFLAEKLIAKARKEDKIAVFKGVHYQTPSTATAPGRFINKMDGMLKVMDRYRGKAYKAHELGTPTDANVLDYINGWVRSLPYDFRVTPDLKLGLSDYWHKAYHRSRELSKGTNTDYKRDESFVEDYSNIQFVPHAQLEGQDFMYITTDDNLGVMFNVKGEESMLQMEKRKRNIDAYADYKFGFFVKALGATDADGNALGFDDQIFFSNDVEVLQDVYVPSDANDATPSVKAHNALIVGAQNTAATNITKIDDVADGQYVYLYGDSDVNVSTVKNGANIILDAGDFALTKGNLIKLRGLAGGKVIEISRKVAGAVPNVEAFILADGATTADAANGTIFKTVANAAPTAFTDIENAIAGEKYTIKGGSNTNATTIANGGKFLLTAAMTLTDLSFIVLEYNGQKFIEYSRG